MFAVEMRNITKQFGSLVANDSVNFSVQKGEIHALVGENGAGKSTLMNILYGLYQPDHGEIFIDGTMHQVTSPRKAIKIGIGMVHQHFMLVTTLSVLENIILGSEPLLKFDRLNIRHAEKSITELCNRYSIAIDPKVLIETLSVGFQQRVEILKLLYRNADILILDEPTPVLTPQEVEELFNTLRNLKNQGKTVILITHKLSEVMSISDNITVMRRGKVVERVMTKATSQTEIARKMVGEDIEYVQKSKSIPLAEQVLVVDNLSASNDRQLIAFQDVSFTISKGEIFGIAAVEGNGQVELTEVLTGLRSRNHGKVTINGIELAKYERTHIGHIPEDRLKHGLIKELSLAENLLLGKQRNKIFYKFYCFSKAEITKYADRLIHQYDIRPPIVKQSVLTFSGGNQQKAIVARELSKDAPLIIAVKPTRGLDIKATKFVHDALLSERSKGKGILLVSSDLEELLLLSDRIAVMYEGEIVAILNANETTERELGQYMTGSYGKSA
ncbi:MAG: ABC transporter ATP-binding protein [Ignavibacteriales bacterium]|nr:ABC transporter ATP-binding protein [Ignavibacteriales bacterium]